MVTTRKIQEVKVRYLGKLATRGNEGKANIGTAHGTRVRAMHKVIMKRNEAQRLILLAVYVFGKTWTGQFRNPL